MALMSVLQTFGTHTFKCHPLENYFVVCGPEFGLENVAKKALIHRALYNGKTPVKTLGIIYEHVWSILASSNARLIQMYGCDPR
jgi:hypothetical protein